ncbi:peptidoglycan recognition protein family protein, partial [Deinococcus pimensis]|uniref:peptidoglycan recognition protein family protein n=1 Tax=Deinococcus pimensis TaxID=309888 RepID=UPI000488EC95
MNHITSRRDVLRAGMALGGLALLAACGVKVGPPDAPANDVGALAVTVPPVASCDAWKAQPARDAVTVLATRPTRVLVHHTATPNSTDLSQAHAYDLARSIQQSHFDNGWIDSGQHFTISRGGWVTEGRHGSLSAAQGGARHVVGAHCPGQNEVAVGIENEGLYSSVTPPAALYDRLVELCAWLTQQYGISPTELYGHRDFYSTECPGDVLYGMLPQLRRDVAARRGLSVRVWPTVRGPMTGERVRTVQHLLGARGQSVTVDGSYGTGTQNAVKAFQSGVGLTADGLVGSATWERLVVTV